MSAGIIEHAKAELWRYPLPGATGGSGVTEIDLIVVELKSSAGETGMGFSYVLGGGGEAVLMATNRMLQEFVEGNNQTPPAALWTRLSASGP